MLNNFDRILQVLMLLMGIGMVLEPEFFAKQFKRTPILYRISYLLEEFVIQSIFKEKGIVILIRLLGTAIIITFGGIILGLF